MLEEKRKEWLREEVARESTSSNASQFMFDHTSTADTSADDADDKAEKEKKNEDEANKNESTDKELKSHPIAAICYATGGVLMTKYLARFKGDEKITSAVTVSSYYDVNTQVKNIEKNWWFFHPFYLWSNKQKSLSVSDQ